jgi:Bacterial mobilisation protein (MobC)
MSIPRTPPFCLRLTFEERAKIEHDAAGMSIGAYIRSRLLDPQSIVPRKRGKFPVKDHQALAKVLGLLGQSRIANNLNQLAKAANSGSLPVTPETEAELLAAVRAIDQMRGLLMEALQIEAHP